MAVLGLPSSVVVDLGPRLHRHPLEALVDGVPISPPLYDPEGDAVCSGVGDCIVGVDEVDDAERIRFEILRVEAPLTHLVEEVHTASPVLDPLEVAIEPRPAVAAYLVHVDLTSSPG